MWIFSTPLSAPRYVSTIHKMIVMDLSSASESRDRDIRRRRRSCVPWVMTRLCLRNSSHSSRECFYVRIWSYEWCHQWFQRTNLWWLCNVDDCREVFFFFHYDDRHKISIFSSGLQLKRKVIVMISSIFNIHPHWSRNRNTHYLIKINI